MSSSNTANRKQPKMSRQDKLDAADALTSDKQAALKELQTLKKQVAYNRRTVQSLQNARKDYQSELDQSRQSLNDLSMRHSDLVALADDLPAQFTISGKSQYLRSVLVPDVGPAYIPDDIVQQCHAKAETVTYNLTVSDSGSGVVLIYPDHPTNLIGYHYTQNALGAFVYDRALRTAQNLPDNYDYARRVSQLITIKSSTIPSGVYALNGTFNAVRVEGTLSEIPSLQAEGEEFYNGLLTNTVDLYDKVGNVLVGDGIAVLSLLSGVDQPFTRLADSTPISTTGFTVVENAINDMSQTLMYHTVQEGSFTYSPSTVDNGNFIVNVDSTTGAIVSLAVSLSWINGPPSSGYSVVANITFLDPFGNTISTAVPPSMNALMTFDPTNTNLFNGTTFHYSFQNMDGPPIAAIRVKIVGVGPTSAASSADMVVKADVAVPNAARPGVNKPVIVTAYQGVAAGSVLTLSGVTNFELIPNPVLRQNLQLENSYADERELEYAKGLLHNRHEVGIRSVWSLKDYWASRPILEELADVNRHEQALALSGADVVKFFKSKVVPFLVKPATQFASEAIPAAAPVFNALGKAVTNWSAGAASGVPIRASAASGLPFRAPGPYRRSRFVANAMDRKPTIRTPKMKSGVIMPVRWRAVAFPTILCAPGSSVMSGGMLYVATNAKPMNFRPTVQTKSRDGHIIYGLGRSDLYEHKLLGDVWVFPIDPASFVKGKLVPIDGPSVDGHSGDTAIYIASNGKFSGATTVPITGALDANLNVEPNPAFDAKSAWLGMRGIPLAGNAATAHPKVVNVSQVISGIHVFRV